MVYEIIVVTLLLPTIVSAAAVLVELLASNSAKGEAQPDRAAWLAGGVAGAGSFWLAYLLYSWTAAVPSDAWHWLPYAVFGMTATALVAAMAGRAWACAIVVPMALALAWLLTPAWDEVARIRPWVAGGLAAAMLAYLTLAWPLADRRRATTQWAIGIVLVGHLLAGAVIIQCSGWTSLAQLAGVPIVALSVLSAASWLYPRRQFLYGAIPTFAVVFPAALLLAWYGTFTAISPWAFLLAALGPAALLVALVLTQRRSRAAIVAVIVFPIAGVAVALATAV